MSGDFGGLGLAPELMRRLAEQWQSMQATQAAAPMMGMSPMVEPSPVPIAGPAPMAPDMAKMAAPAPSPSSGLAQAPPVDLGQQNEQSPGYLTRLGLLGGGPKGADGAGGSPSSGMSGLSRLMGSAQPRPTSPAAPAPAAPAPGAHRGQGGGSLPMREFTPGNPYLRRRKGLMDNE